MDYFARAITQGGSNQFTRVEAGGSFTCDWGSCGVTNGPQECSDYLFAGRPAPDVSPGFYVERIVCLTPDGKLEPVYHPSDIPGLQAVNEAQMMELLATQRLADYRLRELNRVIEAGPVRMQFFPAVYMSEET